MANNLERQDRHSAQERSASSDSLYRAAYDDQRAASQHGSRAMQELGQSFTSYFRSVGHGMQADAARDRENWQAVQHAVGGAVDHARRNLDAAGRELVRENQDLIQGAQRMSADASAAVNRTMGDINRSAHQMSDAASRQMHQWGDSASRTMNEWGQSAQRTVDGVSRDVSERVSQVQRGASDIVERANDHLKERPLTARAELLLPPVFLYDSQARGRTNEQLADAQRQQRVADAGHQTSQQANGRGSENHQEQMAVRQGDSYWSIAHRYHASRGHNPSVSETAAFVRQLQSANQGRELQPGMSLVIPS